MKLKILPMAFLITMSTTVLLAQQIPSTPTTPQTCTNSADTYCSDAAAVFNAIIANPPVPATTTLAGNVSNLENLITNFWNVMTIPSGTSLNQAWKILNPGGTCRNPLSSQQCNDLNNAMNNLEDTVLNFQTALLSFPTQETINQIINDGENMNQLSAYSTAFYDLFYVFNQLDIQLAKFSPPSSASSSRKASPAFAPRVPATPATGIMPPKK